jgi:hypothetical protein
LTWVVGWALRTFFNKDKKEKDALEDYPSFKNILPIFYGFPFGGEVRNKSKEKDINCVRKWGQNQNPSKC